MSDTAQPDTVQPELPIRYQCRHIRASGRACGVAALRGDIFCYYHIAARRPIHKLNKSRFYEASLQAFGLPVIEDRLSLQLALSDVISRIASNDLDHKRAGKLLYALQLASTNLALHLAETNFEPVDPASSLAAKNSPRREPEPPMANPVLHPIHGILAPLAIYREPGESPAVQDAHAQRQERHEVVLPSIQAASATGKTLQPSHRPVTKERPIPQPISPKIVAERPGNPMSLLSAYGSQAHSSRIKFLASSGCFKKASPQAASGTPICRGNPSRLT